VQTMKAVILNGSIGDETDVDSIHEVIVNELKGMAFEVESLVLRDIEVGHCLGCYGCYVRTPGICVNDDAGREIARRFIQSDLAVLLSPVTFGGYSSQLKKAVDRFLPLISPFFTRIDGEVNHLPRYEQYPRLIGVGVLPHRDEKAERLFTTLVGRNAIHLHAPAHVGGVILSGQDASAIRNDVRALIAAVGVCQ
jgi:hypothetical protein